MTHLHRLTYFSRPRPGLGAEEVAGIVQASRRNNLECGVTGFLLFDPAAFVQVIEGPADALSECLQRLMHDSRHHAVRLLGFGAIDARAFPDWGMGCAALQARHEKLLRRYCSGGVLAPDSVTLAGALQLLQEFSAELMLAQPPEAPAAVFPRDAVNASSIRSPAG